MFGKSEIYKKALLNFAGSEVLARVESKDKNFLKRQHESIDATMLASDVASFSVSQTKDLTLEFDDMILTLNEYLEGVFNIIQSNDGIIDYFRGNFVQSYWPASIDSHADKACESAIEIVRFSSELSEKWSGKWPEIITLIGIHTGHVLRGNFGSNNRMNYTLLGPQLNFTQRLQTANKHFKTKILASDSTEALLKDYKAKKLDDITIAGHNETVGVYEAEHWTQCD